MRSRNSAFTLIELLTVVAIIGVLAAILIGSISKVRDAARRATCASNLREIGAAFPLYAADNKGLYPAPRQPTITAPYTLTNPPPGTNPTGQSWQVEISRYVLSKQTYIWDVKDVYGQTNIAHCPSYDLFFDTAAKMSSQSNISTAGYGMNVNLNVGGANYYAGNWAGDTVKRFPSVNLTKPSTTVLIGDSAEYFINVTTAWTASSSYFDGYNNGAPQRHGGTANYLYADGHIASLTPEAAIVAAAYKP